MINVIFNWIKILQEKFPMKKLCMQIWLLNRIQMQIKLTIKKNQNDKYICNDIYDKNKDNMRHYTKDQLENEKS